MLDHLGFRHIVIGKALVLCHFFLGVSHGIEEPMIWCRCFVDLDAFVSF